MAPEPVEHKLAAILSADAVGYSRLMAGDEAATIRTLSAYREQIGVLVREHRGRVVDAPGDNVLAEFPTALEAVRCAVELQGVLRARNASLPAERRMDFRMGVHMGDVATEGGRIYGDGVNIAARLEALAEAGGVCISATVHEQVRNKLDASFADLGDQTVKNIPDPVRVYRVQSRGESELPKPATSGPPRGVFWIAAAAVGALLLATALWWTNPSENPSDAPVTADDTQAEHPLLALPAGPKIAVLPFTNMSDDPEQEFFSDGLSEDIITKLSRFKDLFVIARNSTFRYKGQAVDVRDVARELGARYVLEGSVRRAGTSLRVTAQLLDAGDGTHLWAETYDRDLSTANIFAVQDEITEQVVATIGADRGVIFRSRFEEVKGKATESLSAYECVLSAQSAYLRSDREREKLRGCLNRAVRDDPDYSSAWVQLTWLALFEYTHGRTKGPDLLDRALRDAQRAVEADQTNQGALAALAAAHFHRHELDRSFAEFDRAIALNPNNSLLLADAGLKLIFAGEGERGISLTRRAAALDPQHASWIFHGIAAYHFQRKEYAEALAAAQKVGTQGDFWTAIYLAAAYGQLERGDEARPAVEELLSFFPNFTLQTASEELEKWNYRDEVSERFVMGLREAGVPEAASGLQQGSSLEQVRDYSEPQAGKH